MGKRKVVVKAEPAGPPTVHVIGDGGVGFWLLVGLVRSSVRPIVTYDTDDLNGGLGHMRLPNASPGTKKVKLLQGFLAVNFYGKGFADIRFRDALFTGKEARKGDLVVDCSDMSGEARRAIYKVVKANGARYLRISYDGATSVVAVSEGMPLTGDETHAGYAAVPTLALSLMAGGIGAEVIAKTDWKATKFIEFQVSLAELAGLPAPEVTLDSIEDALIGELAKVGITDVAVSGR